jgi:hypothetical protein
MSKKLVFFIVFVVIFISEDSLLFGTNRNIAFLVFRYLLYFGILMYLAIKFGFRIDKKLLIPLSLILISFLATMIINMDFRTGYFIEFMVVLLASLISNRIKFKDFAFYFNKIVYVLSAVSLIIFAISIIAPAVIDIFPVTMNYNGSEYNSILFWNVMKTDLPKENLGIFREGGVYVIYLLLAVIIELFHNSEINYKRLLVYITALITVSSTAGYVILAFLMFVYVLKTNNAGIKIGFSIIIALFVIFFFQTLISAVFVKFDPESSQYRSTQSRLSSFVIPIMIFIKHIYGVGLSNFGNLYTTDSLKYFGTAFNPTGESTNTVLNTFAIFGIIYGVLLIYALIRFSRIFGSTKLNMITVLLALLMMTSTQELRFSLLFNVIIMYGIIDRRTADNSDCNIGPASVR